MVSDTEVLTLPRLAPVERGALADAVYSMLRGAILDGTLAPGTRIVEETLARQIDVSRAPLREAIWLLKRDGLLVDESARTTRVVTLSPEAIRELHLLRTVLETVACQHAARRITSDQVAEIRAVVDAMQRSADEDDRRQIADLDYEFHQRLCEASGLPRLVAMWAQQHVLFRLWLNLVGTTLDEQVDHIADTHRSILDAVLSGDDDDIFEHVHEHVYLIAGAMRTERRRWAAEQPRITSPASASSSSTRPHAARQEDK